MRIVVCTGGFDPVHSGHVSYLAQARTLGDKLVVGVNSDTWLERKKGRAFMPVQERCTVIGGLKSVDAVMTFDDSDGSARSLLNQLKKQFPYAQIIFANGGDRTQENIPEMDVSGVEFVFGVGGADKANSSSWILEEWKAPRTERAWGYYRILHEVPGVKVKELTVNPGQGISMQYHNQRNEFWFVTEGRASVYTLRAGPDPVLCGHFLPHEHFWVDLGLWHQLRNETDRPLKIVEIQYGNDCIEDDIVRR